jgi:hypothetical protein
MKPTKENIERAKWIGHNSAVFVFDLITNGRWDPSNGLLNSVRLSTIALCCNAFAVGTRGQKELEQIAIRAARKKAAELAHDNPGRISYVCDKARHLVCLPYSIENLHAMAKALDIKRGWFHRDHYDIPKRRVEEIKTRCHEVVSSREIVAIIREET